MARTKKQPKIEQPAKIVPHIRWMIRRDTSEVLNIETECFGVDEWTEETLVKHLRNRNCIGMVCEIPSGAIVAHMVYELHKNRLKILRFAVHPAYQRKGIGAAMVEKLVRKLSSQRRSKIVIDIRQSEVKAQMWFHSQGFRAVEIDNEKDTYRFEYEYALSPYSEGDE